VVSVGLSLISRLPSTIFNFSNPASVDALVMTRSPATCCTPTRLVALLPLITKSPTVNTPATESVASTRALIIVVVITMASIILTIIIFVIILLLFLSCTIAAAIVKARMTRDQSNPPRTSPTRASLPRRPPSRHRPIVFW